MIRTILIDDEPLAVLYLQQLLKVFPEIVVLETFTDPAEAIRKAAELKPELVFLDIDMPGMHGLQVADHLNQMLQDCDIVFVTAYNQYALEAFEVSALDYILKPIQSKRLTKTVEKLLRRHNNMMPVQIKSVTDEVIRCLNRLQFEQANGKIHALRWRTSKAEELFAYLLHHRKGFVNKEMISDILWPDVDSKKAMTSLYTTIYLIRKTLSEANIPITISNMGGHSGYALELENYTIDVDIWEEALSKLAPISLSNVDQHQQWLDYYVGDYYADHYYVWAESERQRLGWIWRNHALSLAEFYVTHNLLPEAVSIYQRMIDIQPLSELVYFKIMKLYAKLGQTEAIELYYRQLSRLLRQELDIDVPVEIASWYESWKS
ncbi:response regulator [Paenibacillus yanchengensis]|uniref:Response regulator n=1 Tax=Paenibacillus yanchengensis TaxID=2035833 RepID=A0ABW4YPH5_9BACL